MAYQSIDALAKDLSASHQACRKMGEVDLTKLDAVVAYAPEDMTATVQTGLTLAALQERLAKHGQWLPLDPRYPDDVTIEALISGDLSGPRRCGFGTVREHMIGLQVLLADGRCVRSGGRVVKNVAGYDLAKLFVGARRTLGLPIEATFKLQPLPERELLRRRHCRTLREAGERLEAVLDSALHPVVLDLCGDGKDGACHLILGLAGTKEDVAWQDALAASLGIVDEADWSYESNFWVGAENSPPHRWSVAPSRLPEALTELSGESWLARAGQGAILHFGPERAPTSKLPRDLMRRLKQSFDPNAVLPDLPW